jgi:mannosyltransferase OCH1-like enzyme
MPQFIMVVDTVRYLWMNHFGGIYCDMDVYFQKRIEHGDGVVFVEREWTWPKDRRLTTSVHNAWFASEPRHWVWAHIIDGIANNVRNIANRKPMPTKPTRFQRAIGKAVRTLRLPTQYMPTVFDVTGPNAISRILSEKGLQQRYPDLRILPARDIYQPGMSTGRQEDAYAVHQTAGSWKG